MLGVALLVGLDAPTPVKRDPQHWIAAGIIALLALVVISNNVQILMRRPLCLRATRDGVWFGGGPIIPWHEIKGIYEAGVPIERYGYKVRTRAIAFELRRKRTLLRLPSSLWLTSFAVGDVKVSVLAAHQEPIALVCQLDGMRTLACGLEAGVLPGAATLPSARVISPKASRSTSSPPG
jgi:hypothetical protein